MWIRYTFVFFVLFIRLMLVPHSSYATFLLLFVIVNVLVIPAPEDSGGRRFAASRIIFLLALFLTIEPFTESNAGPPNRQGDISH